ncbi:MAG: hypothetical protein ABFQ89_02770, partial [Chloroflexota bacterium]
MVKGKLSLLILSGILVFIISSCGFTTSIEEDTSSLSVVISNPLEDISVSVGDGVAITSTSFSESGIAKVELLVSGQVIVTNGLQDSSTTFVATQNWVPVIPGTFPISVAVEDVDGQRVQSDLLTVTVLEQIAEQPTESTETPLPTLPPSTEEPVTPLPTATPESPQAETPTPTSESPLLLAPIPIEIVPILPTSTPMIKPLPGQLKPIIIPLASPNIQFSVA